MACNLIGTWFIVVIGHQIDGIDIPLNRCHFGVSEILVRRARCNREVEPSVVLLCLLVKSLTQLFEKQSKVLLILSAKRMTRPDHSRILPVNIETIEIVVSQKFNNTLDEEL